MKSLALQLGIDVYCRKASWTCGVKSGCNLRNGGFEPGPVICWQDDQRNCPLGEVLLVSNVLVRSDHRLEAGRFRSSQQDSIGNSAPALFLGGADFVLR